MQWQSNGDKMTIPLYVNPEDKSNICIEYNKVIEKKGILTGHDEKFCRHCGLCYLMAKSSEYIEHMEELMK